MEHLKQTENTEDSVEKLKQVNVSENKAENSELLQAQLSAVDKEILEYSSNIITTNKEISELRKKMGLGEDFRDAPSVATSKHSLGSLENKKVLLEQRLNEILKSDVSKNHTQMIEKARASKIDWAHSAELARRLKLKGASDEDVAQVKDWLVGNVTNAKTFVLSPDKFKEVQNVLHEMTNEENIHQGEAFHVPGGRTDVPEHIKSSIFIRDQLPKPPLPGEKMGTRNTINEYQLNHEMGHVAQDGLLNSELYQDWKPVFKQGAPDPEYVGLINETDTRIRSMYHALGHNFDPSKEVFGKNQLAILRAKLQEGSLDKDVKDLFDHYDDATIIRLANRMPAI